MEGKEREKTRDRRGGPWRAGLAAVALAALTAVPVPAAEASAAEEPDGRSTGETPAVEGEPIEVEGSPLGIPTSNTVATKLPLPLRLTPASVAVIGSEMLEEQGATVLGDALENVAGVNVQTQSGVTDFFVLRGLDSVSSAMILVDGAREPESSFYQLYNVDRVEVLKGPAAFVYGGSPLGGAVNLVRRQPLGSGFVRAGLSGGSFATVEGTVDADTALGDALALRVNGMWRDSDGFRDDQESRELALNPSLTWRPDDASRLSVTFERLDLEHGADSGLPLIGGEVPAVPRTRSYQSPLDTSDQQVDRLQVDYERRVGERLLVRDKAYWRELDWLSRATVFSGAFPDGEGSLDLVRTLLELDDEQQFAGNQLELVLTAGDPEGVSHHLLAGLEVARLTDEFTFGVSLLPGIDVFDPVETAAEPLFPIPGQARSADARSLVVAPYLVDQVRLSERVELFAGLRFDSIDFEDEVTGVDRRDEELSPMLGLVVTPSSRASFYFNAARSFAPPSSFAVAPDQVPEESEQVEAGVKGALAGGGLEGSLAIYQLERENIPIPDRTGVTRQVGSQRSRGLELAVRGEPAPGWRLSAAYAYTDAELTEFTETFFDPFAPAPVFVDLSGNTPAFVPEHLLNLWTSRRLPAGFTVSAGARWVSEQFIDEDNAFTIDDALTLDLGARWSGGPWALDLRLENVTDEETFIRGFGGTSVIPAPGFAAYGGVRYSR